MNKFSNLLIATAAILISQQNCLAQDVGDEMPINITGAGPDNNSVGQLGLLIQQSTKISEKSKHINIITKDGSFILTGTVASDKDRQEIGNLAAKCGITNIKNELIVKPPKKTDQK